MDKEIKDFIEKYTNNNLNNYKGSSPGNSLLREKTNYSTKRIKNILQKTLITPKRRERLTKKFNLPSDDIFQSDTNIFFSPNLIEAIKYLSPYRSFYYFEELPVDSIDLMCFEELFFNLRTYGIYQYLTIEELSKVLKDFSKFLEGNEDSLLATGWPKHHFGSNAWLFYKTAPCYPIKIALYIKNFHKLKNPSDDPYFFLKYHNFNHYPQFNKMVSITKNFSFSELGLMEKTRPKFLSLKKIVFQEINENLFSDTKDKDLCFKNCVKILFRGISKENITKMLEIEKKYDPYRVYDYRVDGGLWNLLLDIIYIYQEAKFGANTLEKNTYDSLLKGSKFREQRNIHSFYQIMSFWLDTDENKRYQSIKTGLNKKLNEICKKIEKNDNFILDILYSYEKEYSDLYLPVKAKHYSVMKNLQGLLEKGILQIPINSLNSLIKSPRKRITPLDLPEGIKWQQITMQFIDNEIIKIKVPNQPEYKIHYSEMGLKDNRKLCPNTQWYFLQLLSQNNGRLSWEQFAELCKARKPEEIHKLITLAKKRKQLLSKVLKEYFQMNEDPFYNYWERNAYEVKFHFIPQEDPPIPLR